MSAAFSGYTVTNPYGAPGPYASGYHTGVDFAMPVGTAVPVVDGGQVIAAGWDDGGYGNLVKVSHAWGESWYAHLSTIAVSVGQQVYADDLVGASGNTGMSTGPHLHFEVRVGGVPVDPSPYLSGGLSAPGNGNSNGIPASVTTGQPLSVPAGIGLLIGVAIVGAVLWE